MLLCAGFWVVWPRLARFRGWRWGWLIPLFVSVWRGPRWLRRLLSLVLLGLLFLVLVLRFVAALLVVDFLLFRLIGLRFWLMLLVLLLLLLLSRLSMVLWYFWLHNLLILSLPDWVLLVVWVLVTRVWRIQLLLLLMLVEVRFFLSRAEVIGDECYVVDCCLSELVRNWLLLLRNGVVWSLSPRSHCTLWSFHRGSIKSRK